MEFRRCPMILFAFPTFHRFPHLFIDCHLFSYTFTSKSQTFLFVHRFSCFYRFSKIFKDFHAFNVFGMGFLLGKDWEERKIKDIMDKDKKDKP